MFRGSSPSWAVCVALPSSRSIAWKIQIEYRSECSTSRTVMEKQASGERPRHLHELHAPVRVADLDVVAAFVVRYC